MEFLKLKTHTVILLVGPSGAGKTYFTVNHLLPQIKLPNVQYISSDDIRRELLGSQSLGLHNHSMLLQNVSEQAFDFLYKKLELVTSYPVKAEIVVVDTTGLNKAFRDKITRIAKSNMYSTCCIVFSYKDKDEYFRYLEGYDGFVVNDGISRLRRKVMAELTKKDFDSYFYIKKKDFSDIEVEIEDADFYLSCHLPHKDERGGTIDYPIIGDLHGDLDALIALLTEISIVVKDGKVELPPYKRPILLGDFIDKGVKIVETIEFLYENWDKFLFVMGNHENFVYKYLRNELKNAVTPQDIIDNFFDSIAILEKDPVLKEKFNTLVELSKPFYRGENFIATHAPCEEKYLGKLDAQSKKYQRNFRLDRFNPAKETTDQFEARLESSLGEILKPHAANNKPFHIWGHFAFKSVARYHNKVGIDTATSHGNKLTSVLVVRTRLFYKSVPSMNPIRDEYLPTIFAKHKDAAKEVLPEVNLGELDEKEVSRIVYAAKDKINYISGTMSPADKDEEKGTLESIETCFRYFRNKNVEKLCLQPKYMGSRAEVLLCRDLEKCSSTTRRGYSCIRAGNKPLLENAYAKLYERLKPFMDGNDFEYLLLDCELVPWYALGKGLIDRHYSPVAYGLESELNLLEETNFEDQLKNLYGEMQLSGYDELKNQMKKKEVKEKLGHNAGIFQAIEGFNFIPVSRQKGYMEIFKEQLRLFASPSDTLEFKPFSILKGIHPEGQEQLFFDRKNSELWDIVSEDKCVVVDLNDFDNALAEGEKFFQEILDAKIEGVVVKPEEVYIKGVAPFMKVRSPQYLFIIYGYDYQEPKKLVRLIKQKRISRKLQSSIDEWEYGKRMLEIKRADISMENKEYVSLFAKMIFEEHKEERFDPRL